MFAPPGIVLGVSRCGLELPGALEAQGILHAEFLGAETAGVGCGGGLLTVALNRLCLVEDIAGVGKEMQALRVRVFEVHIDVNARREILVESGSGAVLRPALEPGGVVADTPLAAAVIPGHARADRLLVPTETDIAGLGDKSPECRPLVAL